MAGPGSTWEMMPYAASRGAVWLCTLPSPYAADTSQPGGSCFLVSKDLGHSPAFSLYGLLAWMLLGRAGIWEVLRSCLAW